MTSSTKEIEQLIGKEYDKGFVTNLEADTFLPGLNEEVIAALSAKKNEPPFMLEWL
ncbi:MAG TPA: Fe-S cluster assembly protein SufB, partial [Methylococcaceae bacterium]|nr:Fe-S cluster assembly protein SufB [Methylococcaceae bacterium]